MPNSSSALAIEESTRYLNAPSLALVVPVPLSISAKAGNDSISMPMKSGMKPALSIMTSAPSSDEQTRNPDLNVALTGETRVNSSAQPSRTSFASTAKRSTRTSPGIRSTSYPCAYCRSRIAHAANRTSLTSASAMRGLTLSISGSISVSSSTSSSSSASRPEKRSLPMAAPNARDRRRRRSRFDGRRGLDELGGDALCLAHDRTGRDADPQNEQQRRGERRHLA